LIGFLAIFSPGNYPSPWKSISVSKHFKMLCRSINQEYLTPIKDPSIHPHNLPIFYWIGVSFYPWMAKEELLIIYSFYPEEIVIPRFV
jgi:hypothetical protein